MNLKKIGGKVFLVNLLADFILSKIPKEQKTIIKVVDCENFYVIKGKTSSKEILDLGQLMNDFKNEFKSHIQDNKISHTIDLIEYDVNMNYRESIEVTYHYNESNCSYHYRDIENFKNIQENDEMIYVSEFPYGHSLSQGRGLYYYGKYIFYNIPSNYPISSATLKLFRDKREEQIIVINDFTNSKDHTLQSAILDVFDFNFEKLENEMKKVDWSVELTDPLSEYEILKEKVEGFIII